MIGVATDMETRGGRFSKIILSPSGSLFLGFLSGILYSAVGAVVKQMTNVHPAQILCYASFILSSMCFPQIVFRGENILGPPGSRFIVFLRIAASGVGHLLRFIAFRYLPIGEAAVIACTYPAFTTLAAKIFLKESFGILQAISLIFTIIGMILVSGLYEMMTQNSLVYNATKIYGLSAAFASTFCITLTFVLTRKMEHVHSSILTFLTGIVTVIESAIVVLVTDKFRPVYVGLQQFLIIFAGISSYSALSIVIIALQNMDAGPVTTMRAAADIVFSFLWQVIFSHDIPDGARIFGAFLVSLSIVLVGFRKQIKARLPEMYLKFC